MTAEESVEEYVSERGIAGQQSVVKQQVEGEGECWAEQKENETLEEVREEPACVVFNSMIIMDPVVEGKVEECHEEAKVKQTFNAEEPMPYGPDESLQDGKKDEEECGFCLFMKAGPCGKRFAAWEACVDDAETAGINVVEKCAQKTHFLKDCMEGNPGYYGPVLQAEKALDEQNEIEGSKTGGEGNPSNLEQIPT